MFLLDVFKFWDVCLNGFLFLRFFKLGKVNFTQYRRTLVRGGFFPFCYGNGFRISFIFWSGDFFFGGNRPGFRNGFLFDNGLLFCNGFLSGDRLRSRSRFGFRSGFRGGSDRGFFRGNVFYLQNDLFGLFLQLQLLIEFFFYKSISFLWNLTVGRGVHLDPFFLQKISKGADPDVKLLDYFADSNTLFFRHIRSLFFYIVFKFGSQDTDHFRDGFLFQIGTFDQFGYWNGQYALSRITTDLFE